MKTTCMIALAMIAGACGGDESHGQVGDDGGDDAPGEDAGSNDGPSGNGGSAGAWIEAHFAGSPVMTDQYEARTTVETPALVKDSTGCCAKYAFDVKENADPAMPEVGFVNVQISMLTSGDSFGGGLQTSGAPGAVVFIDNMTIDPGWPAWINYQETNKDGIVLDGSMAIYAEDLTIKEWNADGAIDNKASISQFVRFTMQGNGNRGIRYWAPGPHYIVESTLENTGGLGDGAIFWFSDCTTAVVKVYASTFNGQSAISPDLIRCDGGDAPTIEYLTVDPRTTGEMHEMFTP